MSEERLATHEALRGEDDPLIVELRRARESETELLGLLSRVADVLEGEQTEATRRAVAAVLRSTVEGA